MPILTTLLTSLPYTSPPLEPAPLSAIPMPTVHQVGSFSWACGLGARRAGHGRRSLQPMSWMLLSLTIQFLPSIRPTPVVSMSMTSTSSTMPGPTSIAQGLSAKMPLWAVP